MRAMVIDDSRAMRMILKRIVSKLNFEVVEAGDVSPLLVDRDQSVRVRARIASVRARSCCGDSTFSPKRQTPARPSRNRASSHEGSVVPTNPGRRTPAAALIP